MGSALMFTLTLVCQWRADWLVRGFTSEVAVIAVSTGFLHVISWNFVSQGIIFTCSAMFQALGNTVPSLISGATRILTFAAPAVWLSQRPGFVLRHLWMLSVATVTLQALVSLWLLRREFRRRLSMPDMVASTAPATA